MSPQELQVQEKREVERQQEATIPAAPSYPQRTSLKVTTY
jgi:hypothetical protein